MADGAAIFVASAKGKSLFALGADDGEAIASPAIIKVPMTYAPRQLTAVHDT